MNYFFRLLIVLFLFFSYSIQAIANSSVNENDSFEVNDYIQLSRTSSRFDSYFGHKTIKFVKEFSSPIISNSSEQKDFNKDLQHYYSQLKELIANRPNEFIFALDHSGFIEIKIKKGNKTLLLSLQTSTSGSDVKGKAWIKSFHNTYSEILLYLTRSMKL